MIRPQHAPGNSKRAERSYTLALEGATYQGSVALIADSTVVVERSLRADDSGISRIGRGERLMPAVAECLEEAGVKRGEIARIVCGAGPGSFTSLRVAGSVAKGLAVGFGVDLFAVSSLLLTVSGARPQLPPGEYLSVLDAMRGELFAARVLIGPDGSASQVEPTTILNGDRLREFAGSHDAVSIVGPGQEGDSHPHARGVAGVVHAIIEAGAVDLASWEPEYGRLAEAQVRWEATHGRPLGR
jgi:tRNA threonylcarbamoyladenosine biosynthesis protein TsaB